jgi:hypothetical protein
MCGQGTSAYGLRPVSAAAGTRSDLGCGSTISVVRQGTKPVEAHTLFAAARPGLYERPMVRTIATALFVFFVLFQCTPATAGAPSAPVCGDVNDSGSVNTSDALLTLRRGVGQQVTLDCSAYDEQYAACQASLDAVNANLVTCNANLSSTNADLTACTATKCGDGVVNTVGEHCDDKDLGDADCQSLGHRAGILRCDESCKFDTSSCDRCPEGSNFHDELCWLLGASPTGGAGVGSCDAACASVGLECDEPALQSIGSCGTDESCRAAADVAAPEGAPYAISPLGNFEMTSCGSAADYAAGCSLSTGVLPELDGTLRYLYTGSATLCSADQHGGECNSPAVRVCACKP